MSYQEVIDELMLASVMVLSDKRRFPVKLVEEKR